MKKKYKHCFFVTRGQCSPHNGNSDNNNDVRLMMTIHCTHLQKQSILTLFIQKKLKNENEQLQQWCAGVPGAVASFKSFGCLLVASSLLQRINFPQWQNWAGDRVEKWKHAFILIPPARDTHWTIAHDSNDGYSHAKRMTDRG